jgi:guanylate kinase
MERVATVQREMKYLPEFDYVVINREGRLDEAVEAIMAIIRAEKCRVHPRRVSI